MFPNPYSQELSVSPHTQAMGYLSVTHTKGQKAALGMQKFKDLQGAGYFTLSHSPDSAIQSNKLNLVILNNISEVAFQIRSPTACSCSDKVQFVTIETQRLDSPDYIVFKVHSFQGKTRPVVKE